MKNLILTIAAISIVMFSSCKKENNVPDNSNTSNNLPANEVVIDSIGNFTINGKVMNLATYMGLTNTKSTSADTTFIDPRTFFFLNLVPNGGKDTTVYFNYFTIIEKLTIDQRDLGMTNFFTNVISDSAFYKKQYKTACAGGIINGYVSVKNDSIIFLNVSWNMVSTGLKVLSFDKNLEYFRATTKNDTVLVYHKSSFINPISFREADKDLTLLDIYKYYKKCKTISNGTLFIKNELLNCSKPTNNYNTF